MRMSIEGDNLYDVEFVFMIETSALNSWAGWAEEMQEISIAANLREKIHMMSGEKKPQAQLIAHICMMKSRRYFEEIRHWSPPPWYNAVVIARNLAHW